MKSVAKNTLYNLIYKLFVLAFPLISSVYVSRVLMPSGIGKVAYAQNIVSYFIAFAGLGMANYGVREIGKCQNDRKKYSTKFLELFLITLITTFVCSFIYYSWIVLYKPFGNDNMLYFVAGFQLILGAFNVDWFYQGMEEYKYITSRSVIIKLISLVFMFITVKNSDDIIPYALMSVVALAGNNVINVIHLRRYIDIKQIRRVKISKHWLPLVILLSATLTVELYTKLDTTMLGIMTNDVNVAYYNYATKITIIVVTLASTISAALLPRLSYYKENQDFDKLNNMIVIAYKAIITITVPAVIGLLFLSNDIMLLLFGKSFASASVTVRILSLLVIIKAIGNLFGVQVLMTFGDEKHLLYSTIFGAISNLIINALLIPIWKENGAAVASVISEGIVCLMQVYYCRKFIRINFLSNIYLKVGISSICMGFVIFIFHNCINNSFLYIITSVIGGVFVYTILSFLVKNDIFELIKKKLYTLHF